MKSRVEQLEADCYKAGRERAEAQKERDKYKEEAGLAKKAKDEAEGKLAELKSDCDRIRKESEEVR